MRALLLIAVFGLGAFFWTFLEYWLHLSFHVRKGLGFDSKAHLDHHAHAGWRFDPIITLAWLGVVLAGYGLGRAAAALFDGPIGIAFGSGFVVSYFHYEWQHAASHLRAPKNRWQRWLRKHHFTHHFVQPMKNQGVTIPLWDIVFGSRVTPDRVHVPRRLAMPWLLDEHGELREEYAADYELVGAATTSERQAQLDKARAYLNEQPVA